MTWEGKSDDLDHPAGLRAIAVHPTNPDIAYASSGHWLYSTTDGGSNWTSTFMSSKQRFPNDKNRNPKKKGHENPDGSQGMVGRASQSGI